MKVIATLILIYSISATAYARETKAESMEMGIVTGLPARNPVTPNQLEIARLHYSKISIIKKALAFRTLRDAAKLA